VTVLAFADPASGASPGFQTRVFEAPAPGLLSPAQSVQSLSLYTIKLQNGPAARSRFGGTHIRTLLRSDLEKLESRKSNFGTNCDGLCERHRCLWHCSVAVPPALEHPAHGCAQKIWKALHLSENLPRLLIVESNSFRSKAVCRHRLVVRIFCCALGAVAAPYYAL